MCINALSRYTLQRPDIFLNDKYLKYFGWMLHDKLPTIRHAAFSGILAPFRAVHDTAEGKPRKVGDEHFCIEKIDLSVMEHVINKFLGRISSAVMDPNGKVQEVAMELMLVLLKDGFLDDVNEDAMWDSTNQRSLAWDAVSVFFVIDHLTLFLLLGLFGSSSALFLFLDRFIYFTYTAP